MRRLNRYCHINMKMKLPKNMLLALMMATSLCGTLSYAETVSGLVVYDGVSETYTKVDERLSIGKNADADIKLLNGAVYDMSTTKKELELGSSSTHGNLTIIDSQYYGSGRNVWVYNSNISVSGETSKLQFCVGETAGQNYRVLLGISGSTVNIDLTNGASFESSASQFVACYGSGVPFFVRCSIYSGCGAEHCWAVCNCVGNPR